MHFKEKLRMQILSLIVAGPNKVSLLSNFPICYTFMQHPMKG